MERLKFYNIDDEYIKYLYQFDKKVLGNNLEYLKNFLMIMRAYENIIYRIACFETGIPPHKRYLFTYR